APLAARTLPARSSRSPSPLATPPPWSLTPPAVLASVAGNSPERTKARFPRKARLRVPRIGFPYRSERARESPRSAYFIGPEWPADLQPACNRPDTALL